MSNVKAQCVTKADTSGESLLIRDSKTELGILCLWPFKPRMWTHALIL